MGQTHTYVKGKGTPSNVPPPLQSKVDFYSTNKRISTQSQLPTNTGINFTEHAINLRGKKRVYGDISPIRN